MAQEASIGLSAPVLLNNTNGLGSLVAYLTLDNSTWTSKLQLTNADTTTGALTNRTDIKEADMSTSSGDFIHDGTSVKSIDSLTDQEAKNLFALNDGAEFKAGLQPFFLGGKTASEIDTAVQNAVGSHRTVAQYRDRQNNGKREMADATNLALVAVDTLHGKNDGQSNNGYPRYLLTAANDGFFYVFKGTNVGDTTPYRLDFSYLPAAMQRQENQTIAEQWVKVAEQDYGRVDVHDQSSDKQHVYLNSGGTFWRKTAAQDGVQQSFAVASMGMGARGMYALNIGGYDRTNGQLTGLDADKANW